MHIPFNSFQLKKTCVGIIKESARHIKNEKDLIKKLFAFLLQNFEINYINHKIFQAFNKLCTHNPEIILENISDFLTSMIYFF